MARISTYTADSTPVSSDKLIGTDSSGATTKNYPLGTVADWLKESGASAVLGQTNYKFQIALDPNEGREPGSFSLSDYGGDGIEFIDVSRLVVSNLSSTGQYIGDYLLSTVGDRVMLAQLDDLNKFGVYRLVSLIENPVEPAFFDAELLFVEGNGALQGNKSYGLATYSASASAGSAIWGSIEGDVTNQTDLVEYIDAEIDAIPAPTLQTVTDGGNTTTNDITANSVVANGTLQLSAYTAGLLQTDASGNVSLDTTSYSTFSGNYDDLTDKPYIPVSGTDFDPVGTDNSTNVTLLSVTENYLSISGQEITAGIVPISLGGTGAGTAEDARSSLNVDEAGTDNSTNVTLAGTYDYLTLSGQEITLNQIDYSTDISNIPAEDTLDSVTDRGNTTTNNITVGNFTANGNITTNTGIFYSGNSTKLDLNQYNAGYLRLLTDNTERVRVTATGNVGIGTTSPNYKLDVAGDIRSTGGNLRLEGVFPRIYLTDTNNNSDYSIFNGNGTLRIYDDTNSADRFAINSTGNVGIGTTDFGLSSFSNWNNLRLGKTANLFFHTSTNTFGFNIGRNFYFASDASYKYLTSDEAETIIFSGGNIDFNNAASGTEDASLTWNTRMRITANGNIGIGTTSPGHKLDVRDGNIKTDKALISQGANSNWTGAATFMDWQAGSVFGRVGAYDYAASTWRPLSINDGSIYITGSNGNVGIGTTSPTRKLHVVGGSTYAALLDSDQDYTLGLARSGTEEWWLKTYTDGRFAIHENGVGDKVTIKAGGNVGIGTTSPGRQLELRGQGVIRLNAISGGDPGLDFNTSDVNDMQIRYRSTTDALAIYSYGTSSDVLTIRKSDGNVGIGTTSPSQKLDVAGSVIINDTSDPTLYMRRNDGTPVSAIMLDTSTDNIIIGATNMDELIFTDDSGEAMRIDGSGNVGIGTTSPGAKLEVNGDGTNTGGIALRESTNQVHYIYTDGPYQYNTIGSSSPNWRWGQQGGNVKMALNNTGLGIGTTSPDAELEISKAGSPVFMLTNTSAAQSWVQYVGSNDDFIIRDSTDARTVFRVSGGGNTYFEGGNVGIGTTSPAANLEVAKGSEGLYLKVGGDNASNGRGLTFSSGSNNGSVGALHTINATSGNGAISLSTAGVSRLFLDRLGNVGIGTTSPSRILHVKKDNHNGIGAVLRLENATGGGDNKVGILLTDGTYNSWIKGGRYNSETKSFLSFETTDSEAVRIDGDGNVGIGTTTPTGKFEISSGSASNLVGKISQTNTAYQAWWQAKSQDGKYINIGVSNNADNYAYINTSKNTLRFLMNSSVKMSITSGGNVGIGTTSPTQSKLVVNGDISIPRNNSLVFLESITGTFRAKITSQNTFPTFNGLEFYTGNDGSTPKMTISDTGNVGIGTTSPASKLDVNGDIAVKGNSIINRTGNVLTIGDIGNIDSVANISIDSANGSTIVLLDDNGHVGFNETSPNSTVDINGTAMEQLRLRTPGGPSSTSDTSGREGDFAYDDLYLYIKTGSGWGRVALDFAF